MIKSQCSHRKIVFVKLFIVVLVGSRRFCLIRYLKFWRYQKFSLLWACRFLSNPLSENDESGSNPSRSPLFSLTQNSSTCGIRVFSGVEILFFSILSASIREVQLPKPERKNDFQDSTGVPLQKSPTSRFRFCDGEQVHEAKLWQGGCSHWESFISRVWWVHFFTSSWSILGLAAAIIIFKWWTRLSTPHYKNKGLHY